MTAISRLYSVPLTTLRGRFDERISINTTKSGSPPFLAMFKESELVGHLNKMTYVGFGYTCSEIISFATDYAVHLDLRSSSDTCLSTNWFYG